MSEIGYFVNTGWTWKQADYRPEDDVFLLWLELEMSDHPETITGAQFEIHLSVKLGDVVIVSELIPQ